MRSRNRHSTLETAQEISSSRSSLEVVENDRVKKLKPFHVPSEAEVNQMKKEEKEERKKKGTDLTYIPALPDRSSLHYKTTYKGGVLITAPNQARTYTLYHTLSPEKAQTQDGMKAFVQQKRQIFLAQMAIDTKKQELKRLEDIEKQAENTIHAKEAEINIFRDQFRCFLENDGKYTMEARKAAEEKARQRIEISNQIKVVSSQISQIRNEIAHHDEKLQECEDYRKFIESLTPKEWRATHPLPELYFKDPNQLLTIIQTLEEKNMFLIQHCQEAEEIVDRYRTKFNEMLQQRDGSITSMLNAKETRQKELQKSASQNEQYATSGEFKFGNELDDDELQQLQSEIADFHESLGFDSASRNDTASMLRHIEELMERLCQKLSTLDPVIVKTLADEKIKKRREHMRALNMEKMLLEQEEKTAKALLLAQMPIQKKEGRPIVKRMIPAKKQSREKREEKERKEEAQAKADFDLLFGDIWD